MRRSPARFTAKWGGHKRELIIPSIPFPAPCETKCVSVNLALSLYPLSLSLSVMKFFAAAAAGVVLGCGSPALAFVHGGGSIVGSSNSRLVSEEIPAICPSSQKQRRERLYSSCHFSCGPVCAESRCNCSKNARRRGGRPVVWVVDESVVEGKGCVGLRCVRRPVRPSKRQCVFLGNRQRQNRDMCS